MRRAGSRVNFAVRWAFNILWIYIERGIMTEIKYDLERKWTDSN